ncbi:MarR family winged helix-turn-helix transcriptional regulator [Clostridium thailandense]|uniref:MarR family winged helix-turn-helix transcriptional regulator n=1 Tax=Clostridium thailandense TaxID=2794346 RepID=UPI00398A0E8E
MERDKNLENPINGNSSEINAIKLLGLIDRTVVLIEQVFDKFYKKFKLSKTQFSALYRIHLAGDEGITLSALGDQMFVTRANITTLVDRMVARGLIKRITNESDRRSIKAVITNQGKEILQEVLPNNQVFSSEILNCLTSKEKERFHEFLLKIQNELIEIYNKY